MTAGGHCERRVWGAGRGDGKAPGPMADITLTRSNAAEPCAPRVKSVSFVLLSSPQLKK